MVSHSQTDNWSIKQRNSLSDSIEGLTENLETQNGNQH